MTMAQAMVAGKKPAGASGAAGGGSAPSVLHDMGASDFANRVAQEHVRFELEDIRRPQQAKAIVRQVDGSLLKSGTADQVYTFKGTLQPGFSLDHIVASGLDGANYGLVNISVESYDLQTNAGGTASDCQPGPLDILFIQEFVQRAIAPLTQEDGKLKSAVTVTVTVYCWKAGEPFRGIFFVGTDAGKRCALKKQFVEEEPQGPFAVLKTMKKSGGTTGRQMVQHVASNLGARFSSFMQRLGG
jgi:hypothetical protein